jgi:cell division protein FtsA
MDTRIGYPNEHLAKGFDEVKSPMYATAVGLVLRGIAEQSKYAVVDTVTNDDKEAVSVKQKTKDLRQGTWFDFFFQKGKELIKDEGEDKKLH